MTKPTLLAALCVLGLLSGCTFNQGAGGQAGVSNQKDHFAYGLQGSKSGEETFKWENTKTRASVNWGGQGTGTFTVQITDSAGTRVLSDAFGGAAQAGNSKTTGAGAPGTWTIVIAFSNFNGQGGFAVDAV
ncbi:MAG: hypothetical protein HY556_07935 [Euryarchaeota archaeon]|nr:hypothetical protein [Euryarchaeota archaeon]